MNRDQMTAPFAEEEIRQFEGRGGKTMTYIEDETVMDRLDAGYGFGNWQVHVDPIPYAEGVVKVRLGVRENGEWAWYEDFGYPNREGGETLKEAVSDGIRRCGRFVGIARDLYRKATYEPGGSRGPVTKPEAKRDDMKPAEGETHRDLGPIERTGAVAKGSGRHSDLEWRQTPDGYHIGFLLEVGDGKAKPQVSIEGPLAVALFAAVGKEPMLGMKVTVKGTLFEIRAPQRGTFYRIKAEAITTDEWTIPSPVEAPSVPLGLETDAEDAQPTEALDDPMKLAAEEAEIAALPW